MTSPRALIYTMSFWPEPTSIGPMASSLAEYLAEAGWEVTVVTGFPYLPGWEIYPSYSDKIVQWENYGAVKVIRSWTFVPKRPKKGLMNTWKRAASDCSMPLSGFIPALLSGRPDVIVSITPPLQAAAVAIVLKTLWRKPLFNWVQDIVPDAALNVGMMREGSITKLAKKLEHFVYKHSDRIGIIVDGFRRNLEEKGVSSEIIIKTPNWVDLRPFDEGGDRTKARASFGFGEDDFVLAHVGTIGARTSAETIVGAMKALENRPEIQLLLVGDGNRRDAIQVQIAQLKLQRVRYLGVLRQSQAISLMLAADLLVLSQKSDLVDSLFPSRLLSYAAASRPVLAAVHAKSEAALFIQKSGCGVVTEPERPIEFAEAILDLQRFPDALSQMGRAGRRYVGAEYERATILGRFEAELSALVRPRQVGKRCSS